MENKKLRKLVYASLLMALVVIGTIIIRIPIPAVNGYVNFGDLFIFLGACIFGPVVGALAGGIGSALADIFAGASQWAIFSLLIKSIMGFVVGTLAHKAKFYSVKNLIGIILAVIILVVGYYIVGSVMIGSFVTGMSSIPFDIMQGVISGVIYFILGSKLKAVIIRGD